MRKNDLVKLNVNKCFTRENGGDREFCLSHGIADREGWITGTRLATAADKERWRNSDASKGMTSAGESKLPPTCSTVKLYRDRIYTVLKARCAPVWSYRRHPGQVMLLDNETGYEVYVKRELIELA